MDADLTEYKPRWWVKLFHISDNCFVTGGGMESWCKETKKKNIYFQDILFFSINPSYSTTVWPFLPPTRVYIAALDCKQIKLPSGSFYRYVGYK